MWKSLLPCMPKVLVTAAASHTELTLVVSSGAAMSGKELLSVDG